VGRATGTYQSSNQGVSTNIYRGEGLNGKEKEEEQNRAEQGERIERSCK